MSHGGGGGQKSAKKLSRIIWMAPNLLLQNFLKNLEWIYKYKVIRRDQKSYELLAKNPRF